MIFLQSVVWTGMLLFSSLFAQSGADSTAVAPVKSSPQTINMGWMLFKTIGVLFLIVALILLLVFLMRRYVFNSPLSGKDSDWIQILGQVQIQPKKFLTLVKVLDRVVLVGMTDSSIVSLAEFNDPGKIEPFLETIARKPAVFNQGNFLGLFRKKLES